MVAVGAVAVATGLSPIVKTEERNEAGEDPFAHPPPIRCAGNDGEGDMDPSLVRLLEGCDGEVMKYLGENGPSEPEFEEFLASLPIEDILKPEVKRVDGGYLVFWQRRTPGLSHFCGGRISLFGDWGKRPWMYQVPAGYSLELLDWESRNVGLADVWVSFRIRETSVGTSTVVFLDKRFAGHLPFIELVWATRTERE